MGLVTAKEVAKAINTDKYGVLGTFSGWLLMKVLKISTLNDIYDRNKHLKDVPFLNAILDEFQIKFEIPVRGEHGGSNGTRRPQPHFEF